MTNNIFYTSIIRIIVLITLTMARKKREWYPGATYHVMSRGNRKAAIFNDVTDNLFFLKILGDVKELHPFKIHSICLMTNHFHMAIEIADIAPGRIMQKALGSYANYYNQRHSLSGHVFEGRYASSLIEDERYFLEVSRYIHLNPVKARMVRDPRAYEYSSYDLFVSGPKEGEQKKIRASITELVDTTRVLGSFGNNREQYRMFVEGKLSHAEQELLIMKDMNEDEMWIPW